MVGRKGVNQGMNPKEISSARMKRPKSSLNYKKLVVSHISGICDSDFLI